MESVDPNVVIDYTIRDLERAPDMIDDLKSAWRSGDLEALSQNPSVVQMREEFPVVYESLLVTRNRNWMATLLNLSDDEDIEFVLVGALHLVGEEGLLVQLEKHGFEISKLK